MADEIQQPAVVVVETLAAEQAQTPEAIEIRGEQFRLAAKIPAIVVLRLAAVSDGKVSPSKQMAALDLFLERAIHADDRERFEEMLLDAEPPIDFDELNTVVETVTEVISARPTVP
jgi:hypothetical protein